MADMEEETGEPIVERIYCMDVYSGRPAKLARTTLNIHLLILVLGAVFGLCSVIASLETTTASREMTQAVGTQVSAAIIKAAGIKTAKNDNVTMTGKLGVSSTPNTAALVNFAQMAVQCLVPFAWLIVIRQAIQNGQRCCTQTACCLESCSSCCMIGLASSLIWYCADIARYIRTVKTLAGDSQGYYDSFYCSTFTQTVYVAPDPANPGQYVVSSTPTEQQLIINATGNVMPPSCSVLQNVLLTIPTVIRRMSVAQAFSIIGLIVMLVQCIVCCWGAFKTNEVSSFLDEDKYFCVQTEMIQQIGVVVGEPTEVNPQPQTVGRASVAGTASGIRVVRASVVIEAPIQAVSTTVVAGTKQNNGKV